MEFNVTLKASPAVVCQSCQYPLDTASKVGTRLLCPRCNNWSDVASDCSGSCLSCHSRAPANSEAAISGCGNSLANSKENNGIFGALRGLSNLVLAVFKRS